jgi:hypothetical protein
MRARRNLEKMLEDQHEHREIIAARIIRREQSCTISNEDVRSSRGRTGFRTEERYHWMNVQ